MLQIVIMGMMFKFTKVVTICRFMPPPYFGYQGLPWECREEALKRDKIADEESRGNDVHIKNGM